MHALTISIVAKDRGDSPGNPRASLRQLAREMFAVRSIIRRRGRAVCPYWHFAKTHERYCDKFVRSDGYSSLGEFVFLNGMISFRSSSPLTISMLTPPSVCLPSFRACGRFCQRTYPGGPAFAR